MNDSESHSASPWLPSLLLIPLVAVVGFITFDYVIPRPLQVCGRRSPFSRTKADLRSMATALESYFIDHDAYPAWTSEPHLSVNSGIPHSWELGGIPTFAACSYRFANLHTLTTPVAYISSPFSDPYSRHSGTSFAYWSKNSSGDSAREDSGWLLWSPGPDGTFEITRSNIEELYDPKLSVPNERLIELTYDPTNGARSSGDIWRAKQ